MSEPHPGTSSFETRLEAMERRLAEIQQELASDVPPPAPVPEEPPPARPAPSTPPEPSAAPAPPPTAGAAPAPPPPAGIQVSAGPFRSMEALRAFEQAVAELPGVREVAIRGYESGNRAILEVQLEWPPP